jgi:uncharacterized phage protein (TIGR02218 family)
MRILNEELLNSLLSNATTLCYCWHLTRKDGIEQGFTSLDRTLTIDGISYLANSGIVPTASESSTKLEVNNLSLSGFFSLDLEEEDLISGVYDLATLKLFLVDYLDLPTSLDDDKAVLLLEGTLGKTLTTDRGFVLEMRSLTQYLNQKQSQVTSPFCRYDFGDTRCTVNLSTYTDSLEVDSVLDNKVITTTTTLTADVYRYGFVTFTSGAAEGLKVGVAGNTTSTITLFEAAPQLIEAGDTLEATQGCAKTREACKSYSNILNFGGEPDVPGIDEYLAGYEE